MMSGKPKKDASRVLRLIDHINKRTPYGGVTIKELADKYEVTGRQTHRDLNAIQIDLKVLLVEREQVIDGRKSVSYYLEAGYLPSLSPEKATAIFLSMLQQQGSALAVT